jgi:hypothetical protein
VGSKKSTSSSSSSSSDNRTVVDGGGIAMVGSSNATLNITDGGIIKDALAYLGMAEQANTDRLKMLIEAGAEVIAAQQKSTETLLGAKQTMDNPGMLNESQVSLLIVAAMAGLIVLGAKK